MSPKQPSTSCSSCPSACLCYTPPLACLFSSLPLALPSRQKTPKCAAKSAEKRKIVQTTTRQMPKPSPLQTANPRKMWAVSVWGRAQHAKDTPQKRKVLARLPPSSIAQKRYKRGRGRGSAGVALKFPLRVVMAAVCVRCVCVGRVSVCVSVYV